MSARCFVICTVPPWSTCLGALINSRVVIVLSISSFYISFDVLGSKGRKTLLHNMFCAHIDNSISLIKFRAVVHVMFDVNVKQTTEAMVRTICPISLCCCPTQWNSTTQVPAGSRHPQVSAIVRGRLSLLDPRA